MNINELFEEIQDHFHPDDLNGEFTLQGNCIVWTYDLNNEEIDIIVPNGEEDDDALMYGFDSTSSEESLNNAYEEDLALLEEFLDTIDEGNNWSFSEPDIYEDTISFRIF